MKTTTLQANGLRQLLADHFWRYGPLLALIVVCAFVLAGQILHPHHRMIKAAAMGVVLALLLKFDLIYSLYFFLIVWPFPAGVLVTTTNVILMTMIPLLWIFRANSAGVRVFERTEIDWLMLALLLAYVVSMFNVEGAAVIQGWKIIWRHLTLVGLFYVIVRVVDTEKKLEGVTKVWCIAAGLLFLTGVLELFMPGQTIIPGWISMSRVRGMGRLGFRVEGLRVGGASGSQGLVADLSSMMLFLVAFYFLYTRNILKKIAWLALFLLTLVTLLATANRGATLAVMVGMVYAVWVFRHSINPVRYILIVVLVIAFASVAGELLLQHTVAVSIIDRIVGTQVGGVVPDARRATWIPALERSMEHIFIGHGPYFGVARGLYFMYWPHNAFIYYLFTLGLFGFISFTLIVYKLLRISMRYSRPAVRGKFLGTMMGILHIQLILFLIESMRADHQRDAEFIYIYLVWILFGLIAATGNLIKKREAEEQMARAQETAEEAAPEPVGTRDEAPPPV